MKPEILPFVLSDLLEIAVNESEACSKTPRVTLNMAAWLGNNPEEKSCSACMAGAVMLRRGLVTSLIPPYLYNFSPEDCEGNKRQLEAINAMRTGWFEEAYCFLHDQRIRKDQLFDELYREVRAALDASEEPTHAPWSVYRKCIKKLRKEGL